MPKYSFLLPAFKGRFLDEMLRSIQGQTYTDFKVIISDDCSPEDLRSICEPYLKDPRFTYRRNAENMGSKSLVSHWNLLVDMCDTEFLIMASDDDVYEPEFLTEIDKLTVKYPNVDLFRGKMKCINEKGEVLVCDPVIAEYLDQTHFFYNYYTSNILTCEANYVYRTESLKEHGNYKELPLAWFTDDLTHIVMSEKGCATTNTILFSYRNSPISISNTWGKEKDAEKKIAASIKFWDWIDEYVNVIKDSDEKSLKTIAMRSCKNKVRSVITTYSQFLTLKDFYKHIPVCCKSLNMSIIILTYSWLRIYLHKIIHQN